MTNVRSRATVRRTRCVIFLLILWVVAAHAQGADLIAVDSAFVTGQYDRVELLTLRILQSDAKLTNDETAKLCLTAGYSLIMLNRENDAREYFGKALDAVPTLTLDPVQVSPKFRVVFDEVKTEHQPSVRESIKTDSKLPSLTLQGDVLTEKRKSSQALNLLISGVGHFREGHPIRGAFWMGAQAASAVFFAMELQDSNDKRKKYLSAEDETEIQKRYDDYNSSYQMTWVSAAVAAGIYLASQVDLAFLPSKHTQLSIYSNQDAPSIGLIVLW